MKKNVLIINEGFSHNFGDQAIKKALEDFYKDHGFETHFLYLSRPSIQSLPKYNYNVGKTVKNKNIIFKFKAYFNIFYWLLRNRKAIIKTLISNDYHIITIGGGQLIDTSGTNLPNSFSIALFWITNLIKRYARDAKIFFIGVGVGSSFNKTEKVLYSKALSKVDGIWVRDIFSKQRIQKTFKKEAFLMPDIAFYTKEENVDNIVKQNLALVGIANYEEVIIKYNKNISKENYYYSIAEEIENFKREGLSVRLFYSTLVDVIAIKEFNNYLISKNKEKLPICKIQNLMDLIQELKSAKVIFSGRMHALILGLKYGCQVKPYLLSQKLRSFNDEYVNNIRNVGQINGNINDSLKIIF